MIGKISTCDCIVDLDENNHTGSYIFQCKEHLNLRFNADEVIAEHVAIQMHGKKKAIERLIKKWF